MPSWRRSPDEKLRWAFRMYDEDNSRQVDLTEMENVMKVERRKADFSPFFLTLNIYRNLNIKKHFKRL